MRTLVGGCRSERPRGTLAVRAEERCGEGGGGAQARVMATGPERIHPACGGARSARSKGWSGAAHSPTSGAR